METTQTVELLLPKFPQVARRAFRVPNITRNLVAVRKLCDVDCGVYFHKTGVEIEHEGDIIGHGWQDHKTRLWRVPLTSEGGQRITPHAEENEQANDTVYHAEINSIYECENK